MTTHSPPVLPLYIRRSLLVGVAVLSLAGCGSSNGGSATAASKAPSKQASPTPRVPADGTDLDTCKDGSCEVQVTGPAELPVDQKKFKIDTLEVKPDTGNTVSFNMKQYGNSSTSVRVCSGSKDCLDLGGGGYSSDGNMESTTGWTAEAGTRITANELVITVLSVTNGSAILRLRPA